MDAIRFGLGFRALRRRRHWTQEQLARAAGVSRSVVWRIERGRADRVPVQTLDRIAAGLGGRVDVRLLWQGEALDRLLDAGHAELVEHALGLLAAKDWHVATEVSFQIRGERGSIDILAFHPATRSLLVIEVKSTVPDIQATLHGLDRKVRLSPEVAGARGWQRDRVARVLVLPNDRTARRRVDEYRETFRTALPARTTAVLRWIRQPEGPMAGILFLSDAHQASARHRVARTKTL